MVAAARQVEIGGLATPTEQSNEVEAAREWRGALWPAIRSFVEGYIDAENGLKKYDGCAYRLNAIWEDFGRPVTSGALKQALLDAERNNFRLEWVFWFASQDADIAKILAQHVKPEKTAEQLLSDLLIELLEDLSPKRIQAALKRAKAR